MTSHKSSNKITMVEILRGEFVTLEIVREGKRAKRVQEAWCDGKVGVCITWKVKKNL